VPEGTPNFIGAMGTVNTCTSQGFIKLMFSMTVATYYVSLILQAFMGIRNSFKEENYRWIEIPIHLVAFCIPCAVAIVYAVTENINPSSNGCWYTRAPQGCDSDPDIACQRGQDIKYFGLFTGFAIIFLYFIFPTLVVLAMGRWMKKTQNDVSNIGSGMIILREKARKEMMHSVFLQVSVYLFSFWFTSVLAISVTLYQVLTGVLIYNLTILGVCLFTLQGFVFMVVYFALQKMGERSKREYLETNALSSRGFQSQLTVSGIRSNAQRRTENPTGDTTGRLAERFSFNIFDGTPDPDSPWAMFFDQDNDSGDEDTPVDGIQSLLNEEI